MEWLTAGVGCTGRPNRSWPQRVGGQHLQRGAHLRSESAWVSRPMNSRPVVPCPARYSTMACVVARMCGSLNAASRRILGGRTCRTPPVEPRRRVGLLRVVRRHHLGDVDEVFGLRRLTGTWVGRHGSRFLLGNRRAASVPRVGRPCFGSCSPTTAASWPRSAGGAAGTFARAALETLAAPIRRAGHSRRSWRIVGAFAAGLLRHPLSERLPVSAAAVRCWAPACAGG